MESEGREILRIGRRLGEFPAGIYHRRAVHRTEHSIECGRYGFGVFGWGNGGALAGRRTVDGEGISRRCARRFGRVGGTEAAGRIFASTIGAGTKTSRPRGVGRRYHAADAATRKLKERVRP